MDFNLLGLESHYIFSEFIVFIIVLVWSLEAPGHGLHGPGPQHVLQSLICFMA